MSDYVSTLLLVTAVFGMITAGCSAFAALVALRVKKDVNVIHISLNSRLDQLLAATGAAERAAGVVEGTAASAQAVGVIGEGKP